MSPAAIAALFFAAAFGITAYFLIQTIRGREAVIKAAVAPKDREITRLERELKSCTDAAARHNTENTKRDLRESNSELLVRELLRCLQRIARARGVTLPEELEVYARADFTVSLEVLVGAKVQIHRLTTLIEKSLGIERPRTRR
ncbi:MAG: hypothetical protein AAB865_00775 [Patescibacteria group bacterium]